ncbi:hypothetical protein HW555_000458, partial [Spodoptera exigua]
RSPAAIPGTLAPVTSVKLSQAASDSDIPHTVSDEEIRNVNLSLRYKRPRSDSSPVKNQLEEFKDEIFFSGQTHNNTEIICKHLNQKRRTSNNFLAHLRSKSRNVTLREGESSADLTEIVTKVGSVFGMAINKAHIRDIYRLPGKPGTNKPIVTEFSSVQTKQQLLTLAKDFNRKHSKEDRLNSKKIGLA